MTTDQNQRHDDSSRYRCIEFEDDAADTITIVQDTENDRAWVQSTLAMPIRR
jgi:hypothetical protein